ncbi:MAG: hypothetical protein KDK12_14210 [Rhodobacteraceae bacterium]|nr:hypothetical protein [Paracoccaceae bacterium]
MRRFLIPLAMFAADPAAGQMVVDGAGVVSPTEVDAFVLADANRDGQLSYPEFRIFVRRMAEAGAPNARLVRRFGAYGLAFGQADADGDGQATPRELRRADEGFGGG